MAGLLHEDEIPIDRALVRSLVDRAMPEFAEMPLRRLRSSGSSNALFRLGDGLIVRLPRQRAGSKAIVKEARWLPVLGPQLPITVPHVVAVGEPDLTYPAHWSVVDWIEGEHPQVVDPTTMSSPRSMELASALAEFVLALHRVQIPAGVVHDPDLHWYRGDPLASMDEATRANIARCRALGDFEFDLDAAEQIWCEAMKLPGSGVRAEPRWYHGDLAAENLLVRDGRLAAVLDFGALSVGDPTIDLIPAWQILDPPARESFRRALGIDDASWLRGRAWALCIALMIWYYWDTMPTRRATQVAVGRNILADAGFTA